MKGDLNKKQMKGASRRGRNFVVENRELIQEIQSILGEEIKEIRKLQEQTNNEVKEIKKIMVVNKLSQLVDNYDKIAKIKQKKLEKDIKVKPKKEIEAKRGGVYLIRFDPLKKGKFKRVVKDTEIKDLHSAVTRGLASSMVEQLTLNQEVGEKEKFIKRYPKEEPKDMKKEIEAAIRALENGENVPDNTVPPEPVPRQNNPDQKASPNQIPRKIIILAGLFFLIVIIIR
ncbi:36042_t:CDS:2, partial [Racocetra persica]